MHRWKTIALVLTAVLALAGCREEEQGRRLGFEPGVYKGEKLPALTDNQLRALQDRSRLGR
jgi:hypothetical protein